jgi:hypothetical protein
MSEPLLTAPKKNTFEFTKEMLVFFPLVGTAIALFFDVGYFQAVDLDLFTLFSLSEHILFSIEALPLTLFILLVLACVIVGFHYSSSINTRFNELASKLQFLRIGALAAQLIVCFGFLVALFFPRTVVRLALPTGQRGNFRGFLYRLFYFSDLDGQLVFCSCNTDHFFSSCHRPFGTRLCPTIPFRPCSIPYNFLRWFRATRKNHQERGTWHLSLYPDSK